jgi:hypothetical protein
LLRYVDAYRQRGDAALILYADKSKPVSIAQTLDRLRAQFTAFARHAPGFVGYLGTTPQGRRPGMRESIMWSTKDFGYRPTISVDHVVVDPAPEPEGAISLFASKTIYANHYLAGRIQMGVVLDGNAAFGIPGTFLLLVDRVEFDAALGGFKRSLLVRGLTSDLEGRMKRLRSIADGR